MPEKNTFYVTTPIYYVNAKPHLGSLYSTLLADVAARWHQIQGQETFLLTGLDEHGQKVAEAAETAGKTPQDFVDSLTDAFKDLWPAYHIHYNNFIRTTDSYHVKAVQDWITQLQKQGDIYKDSYEGWYDVSSEAFLTDKDLEFVKEGEPPISALSGKSARWVVEECYFFRLSSYQDKLLEFYKNNPDFVTPSERLNEVIAFVEGGLKDLCISRKTLKWGIPFPEDSSHVTYVWADALNNYITGIGYGDESRTREFEKWWPANLQVMGKDIVRFHAIYWPAFLMASKLSLPKKLLVHGWIKLGGQKMSKSLANVVDPVELAKLYDIDVIRYYLTRYMAVTQDSSFSTDDLEQKVNTDLANDCGNLLNRMLTLALKNDCGSPSAPSEWGPEEKNLQHAFVTMVKDFEREMEGFYFHKAYAALWRFINKVNAYFHAQEPWKLAKSYPQHFSAVMSATCHSLYGIAVLLWPVLPNKMEQLLGALGMEYEAGHDYVAELKKQMWNKSFGLKKVDPIFKKYETKTMEEPVKEPEINYIKIDQFIDVELLVGQIITTEALEKSDKLLKMQVDFGDKGKRQICAGLKQYYQPEDLLNKKAVFVYNLKPRKLMGLESQGMVLTTKNPDEVPVVVTVGDDIPVGTRLK